jgi:hypothetical protein
MAMRNANPQTLASSGAARHVRRGPCLVDIHQAFGIEIELALEPGLTLLQDVGAVLLGSVRSLFCA